MRQYCRIEPDPEESREQSAAAAGKRRWVVMAPSRSARRARVADLAGTFFESVIASASTAVFGGAGLEMPAVPLRILGRRDAAVVEMDDTERLELVRNQPGLRLCEAAKAWPQWLRVNGFGRMSVAVADGATAVALPVDVTDVRSGAGIGGIDVSAILDLDRGTFVRGRTDPAGRAILRLPPDARAVPLLTAEPAHSYWSAFSSDHALDPAALTPLAISLEAIDPAGADGFRRFLPPGRDSDGAGVVVGVVDTGIGPHRDLVVAGGMATVFNDDAAADTHDNGLGHGTHVAGIIAARGDGARGVRGVAPGVKLMAYRVFARAGGRNAESPDIAKAIEVAVADGCHLINLSLGSMTEMPEVQRQMARARQAGVVCLAAAGNDGRRPVRYPARYPEAVAVAAFGRRATYPDGTLQIFREQDPFGTEPLNYVADFSNIGSQIQLIGPGVGVVSTYPDDRLAVMDGTSMACPAMTGVVARLLSGPAKPILEMKADSQRADEVVKLTLKAAAILGFGAQYEGSGAAR